MEDTKLKSNDKIKKTDKLDTNNSFLKVMYTNADQLPNKIDLMKNRCMVEVPHVIGINELKPKNAMFKPFAAEFNMEELNYRMFPNNIEEEVGRGQLLYVSNSLNAKRVYLDSKFEEIIFVKVDLQNNEKLLIGLIYRSPSSGESNNGFLNSLMDEVVKYGATHLLLMGDFNYKTIDWVSSYSDDHTEQVFIDNILEKGFVQHVH